MPITYNLRKGIDLPVYTWMNFMPVPSAVGCCSCNDERGTDRYIYILLGATSFWRYDCWLDSYQQLANPPAFSYAAGTAMVYDPSRGYVWLSAALVSSPWHMWAYYDPVTNAWTSKAGVGGLAAAFGTDACLAHTCTTYNVAGNDDYFYLIGNNGTVWWRYSWTGNAWTSMATALPAAAGAGCYLQWVHGYNTDRLYYIRGTATATIWYYSIGTPGFTALTYYPNTETFTTGTCSTYDALNRIYIQKDTTHRIYYLQLDENKMYPAGMFPYVSGATHVGDGLLYVKTVDGAEYIYYRRQTGAEVWRALVNWWT